MLLHELVDGGGGGQEGGVEGENSTEEGSEEGDTEHKNFVQNLQIICTEGSSALDTEPDPGPHAPGDGEKTSPYTSGAPDIQPDSLLSD